MATKKEIQAIKAINEFYNNLCEKRNAMKSVSYKTVNAFFKGVNELLNYEYFVLESEKQTLHTYKVIDLLRYNDKHQEGYCIEMTIGAEKYKYHTKEDGAAWGMNFFLKEVLKKGGLAIFCEIRELKKTSNMKK